MNSILPQLKAIERQLKAMIPRTGKDQNQTFQAAAESESLERVAGTLYSIEECARLLRGMLDVKLDIVGDAHSSTIELSPRTSEEPF